MTPKPLDFIDVRHVNMKERHVSSLSIHGRLDKGALTVVGGLPHNTHFVPESVADADKLINWLREWKAAQLDPAARELAQCILTQPRDREGNPV